MITWASRDQYPRNRRSATCGTVRPWLLLGLGLLGFVPGGQVRGQVSVDHLEMVLQAVPGQSGLGALTVTNAGDEPVQVRAHMEDWDRDEDGRSRWYDLGATPGSCGDKVHIFPSSLSLDPGASQAIRVTLDPTSTFRRECWTAVVVQTVDAPSDASTVGQIIRTATKVYVQPPAVTPRGEVQAMEASTPSNGSDEAQVQITFENTGDAHLVAKGELQVRTPDNRVLATVPLKPTYVLPGARGRVKSALPALDAGRYVLLAVFDYGGAELAAGQIEYQVR